MSKNRLKTALLIGASVLTAVLCGCETPEKLVTDQCLRQELFKQCMAAVPKGPERVGAASSDWQEVVAECGTQAYYQAKRKQLYVKPECSD